MTVPRPSLAHANDCSLLIAECTLCVAMHGDVQCFEEPGLAFCRKIFGLSLSATAPENGRQAAARKEAAAKVAANRSAIIGDLLKNSGIVRSKTNQYGNTLRVRKHGSPTPTCLIMYAYYPVRHVGMKAFLR